MYLFIKSMIYTFNLKVQIEWTGVWEYNLVHNNINENFNIFTSFLKGKRFSTVQDMQLYFVTEG